MPVDSSMLQIELSTVFWMLVTLVNELSWLHAEAWGAAGDINL